jgi:hypothetical protein
MAMSLWPTLLAILLLAVTVAVAAPAQPDAAPADGGETRKADEVKPTTTAPAPRRRPPMPFRPRVADGSSRRESGIARASRGAGEKEPPRIHLLAPEASTVTTTREQPTLFWYISEPTERNVRLSLTPTSSPRGGLKRFSDPVVSVVVNGVKRGGIHALDLSKTKGTDGAPVKLEEGAQYKWVIEFELSTTERAKNPVSSCTLKRIAGTDTLAGAAAAGGWDAAAAYAQAGVWCEALAALQQAIEADPNNASLRAARREMLASQKLEEDEKGNIRDVAPQK